jgi:hypothetical protein
MVPDLYQNRVRNVHEGIELLQNGVGNVHHGAGSFQNGVGKCSQAAIMVLILLRLQQAICQDLETSQPDMLGVCGGIARNIPIFTHFFVVERC